MIRLQKNHIGTLLIGFLIVCVLSAGFYYGFIYKTEERTAILHKQLLSIQNENIVEEKNPVNIGDQLLGLTQKVPVSSLEEQIILDLEEAAMAADSVILSIGFNDNGAVTESGESNSEDIDTTEEYIDEMMPKQENEQGENISLPNGVRQIQIALSVRSKDYVSLTGFLENIRKLSRIYVVNSISFNGFEENEVRPGPLEDELEYTVELTTYYAPIFKELANQNGIVLPDPAEKENPLHDVKEEQPDILDGWEEDKPGLGMTLEEFLDLIRQNENSDDDGTFTDEEVGSESDSPSNEENSKEARLYTVQPKDTLFSISMKFYGNRDGEAIIKKANGKTSDIVIIGETLRIP